MDIGKRPHKVALVCLEGGNEGAALGLVLDDMAVAGPVYEWLCHVKEPVEFARLDPSDANALSTCDSFVIAFAGKKDAEASALALPIPAGSPRYAVCAHAPAHPGWAGALVVDDLDGVARLMRRPRLGHARRPFSEACDSFLLAVRTGAGFGVEHARGRRF